MSETDRAGLLLEALLKDGPRQASEILAAAQGDNINERTMQRAAESLDVVKTRVSFQGGWTWALPAPVAEPVQADAEARARVIAARIRKLEAIRGKDAPIHAGDPRLVKWVQAGVTDPDLREAYERAVFVMAAARVSGPVTVGFLEPFVAELTGGTA